jgi:hypothetical protein
LSAPPPNSFIFSQFEHALSTLPLNNLEAQKFHQNSNSNIPGLANVDDVDTIGTGLPEVVLHVNLEVLGAEVALSSQEGLNVLAGSVEEGGQVGGSHLDGLSSLVLGDEKEGWLGR